MAVTGCAVTPYRAHPDAARRLPTLRRLALMPPDVKVYSLSAGGVPELMDDWSERGRRNAADAVRRALTAHDGTYVLRDFAPDATDPRLTQQFEDVRALVDAIRSSPILHTYTTADISTASCTRRPRGTISSATSTASSARAARRA